MTKKKAATKKSTSVTLIVFGTLDGKQRAGTFAEADAALATKAATELSLSIREVNDKPYQMRIRCHRRNIGS